MRFAVVVNFSRDIGIYIYNCRDCSHLFLGNWYLHLWLSGLQSTFPGKLLSTFAIVGLVVNFPLKLWSSFAAEALMGFEFFWCYEKMSCTGLWFWNLSRLPGILLWKNYGNADLLQKQILCQLILLHQALPKVPQRKLYYITLIIPSNKIVDLTEINSISEFNTITKFNKLLYRIGEVDSLPGACALTHTKTYREPHHKTFWFTFRGMPERNYISKNSRGTTVFWVQ